ncbi:MAG TPA: hypothetical protein VMB81_11525 [Candidatus Sulfotelmatobacter sp.]|nr:hypothetical protein [Candidatus Sulfotelmatobacter sp.]
MTRIAFQPGPLRTPVGWGLAAVIWLGALAARSPAAAATCDTLAPGRVVLQAAYPTPRLDTSLDLAALQQRTAARDAPRDEGAPLLGLTATSPGETSEADYAFGYEDAHEPNRGICGVAAEIRVRFGFEDAVIYVAREVAADPCLFDEVYRHERRHVEADHGLVAVFAPRLETDLRALLARMGAVRGPTREAVSDAIHARISAVIAADIAAFEREMRRRRDAIDQPEEYRRISTVCGGAGARLIAGLRHPG